MSKRIIYLLLAVSLGLNAGVIGMTLVHRKAGPPGRLPRGEGPPPGRPTDPEQAVERQVRGMTGHLGLDADQQKAIREILERHLPELATVQDEAAEAGQRLAEAYASPDFDAEAFLALVRQTSVARSKQDSLSAVILVAESAVLTAEQRMLFAEVAPTIGKQAQRPPREGGPPGEGRPPRNGGRPPRDGGPPPPEGR